MLRDEVVGLGVEVINAPVLIRGCCPVGESIQRSHFCSEPGLVAVDGHDRCRAAAASRWLHERLGNARDCCSIPGATGRIDRLGDAKSSLTSSPRTAAAPCPRRLGALGQPAVSPHDFQRPLRRILEGLQALDRRITLGMPAGILVRLRQAQQCPVIFGVELQRDLARSDRLGVVTGLQRPRGDQMRNLDDCAGVEPLLSRLEATRTRTGAAGSAGCR